jgi:hypothetical protein
MLPAASVKPESYHQSCIQFATKKALTDPALACSGLPTGSISGS